MRAYDTPSVMKFGGSSFATQAHFGPVCGWMRRRLWQRGPRHRIVCVVSAPSGLTEQYRDALVALNPTSTDRLVDAGLPLADSLGAVLVAAALQAHGVSATVTLGNQIGLRTDTNYTRARLQSVELAPLHRHLDQHQVVVVPGGQAAAVHTGETTWMGKNSSDFSAIALAAALDCEQLEIYSDVPGVFSCDPNIVASASLIPRLPHAQAIQMSTSGAKVLHHRAVEHALQRRLRIVCRRNHGDFEAGTVLEPDAAFEPAIVPDARSQTFIASTATAEKAAEQLANASVPHVLLPGTGDGTRRRRLVVTCGFFDAWHFLVTQRHLSMTKEDTLLLTRLRRDGGIERELVAPSALANRARELHDAHCSAAAPQTHRQQGAASPAAQQLSARLAVLSQPGGHSHV